MTEGTAGDFEAVVLLILDGMGLSDGDEADAVRAAQTPTLCRLWRKFPRSVLQASGPAVGLAPGQMGNSNVGHLHIGAGRVVPQEAVRINEAVNRGELESNQALASVMDRVRMRGSTLHLMGLVSDGRVHSDIEHLLALLAASRARGVKRVRVHAFLDGRDVPPCSAEGYLGSLEGELGDLGGYRVATISGRYYSMDRDNRWERTDRALAAILRGQGRSAASSLDGLTDAYRRGENDEFVTPTVIGDYDGYTPADGFIFFNFRADRARQLTAALLGCEDRCRVEPPVARADLVTMTEYDLRFDCPVAFGPIEVRQTLGEVVSASGGRQLRLAETEKYAHVTYFLNGGREEPFTGEDRTMIPSPSVSTYDLRPEMSACEVTAELERAVSGRDYDLVVANLANPDMVGHTGDFDAAVRAVEAVDGCVARILQCVLAAGAALLVISDHGNAERMRDDCGEPHTAHTANDVPCFLVHRGPVRPLADCGSLIDVAPTVLEIMGIPTPEVMTGRSLIRQGGSK